MITADEIEVGAILSNRGKQAHISGHYPQQGEWQWCVDYQESPAAFIETQWMSTEKLVDLLNS